MRAGSARPLISEHEDFANILLIFAKFLLVAYITAYSILGQIGLDPWQRTQLLNSTPQEQTSVDGTFKLSFYVVSAEEDDMVQITPWICSQRNSDCQVDFSAHEGARFNSQPWRRLQPQTHRIQSGEPQKGVGAWLASLLGLIRANEVGALVYHIEDGSAIAEPGTYSVLYSFSFASDQGGWQRESEPRWVGQLLSVTVSSTDDGMWRLVPLAVVRGQSAALPGNLADFELSTKGEDSRLRLIGSGARRRLDINYRRLRQNEKNGFEEVLLIQSQIESVDYVNRQFRTSDGRTVAVDLDSKLVSYSDEERTYFRRDFEELQKPHFVYFELRSGEASPPVAEVVRFGRQVPVLLPVAFRENLRPRGIYLEEDDPSGSKVRLRVPRDLYLGTINGQRMWYFNLNRHILDPDGVDSAGGPKVEIQQGKVTWISPASERQNYRLAWDRDSQRQLLQVLDPKAVRPEDLQVRISDDWSHQDISLLIRPMSPRTWELLGETIQ